MVDLSVVGLLVALRFLALRGAPKAELKVDVRLLHLCGLLTLALNTGRTAVGRTLRTGPRGHRRPSPAARPRPRRPRLPRPAPTRVWRPTAAVLATDPVPDVAPSPESAPPTPAPPIAASMTQELEPAPTAAPPVAVTTTGRPASGPALPAALLDAGRRTAAGGHHCTRSTLSTGPHRPHPPLAEPTPAPGPGSPCPDQHQHAYRYGWLSLGTAHPNRRATPRMVTLPAPRGKPRHTRPAPPRQPHQLRPRTSSRSNASAAAPNPSAVARLYLIPGLGREKPARLTAKDVRTWLNRLRTTCQCCTRGLDTARNQPLCCAAGKCCHKRLSPLTLAYVHFVLKSALEHTVREEEILRNVARNVRMGTPRPRRFEPRTAEEARGFLSATHKHRLHALFRLALHTGLRKGELLGLRWEDLDLAGGTASIRRTLQRTKSGGLTALPTKTQSSERRIALPTEYRPSLRHHRDRQAREREAAGAGWKDSTTSFTRPDGSPIEGATLTRHFNTLLRRAKLRRIRFHDLRHSTATLLLEQGVELVVIKELLGHAHIGVTATVYAHVRLRLQRDAIDFLGHAPRDTAKPVTEPNEDDNPPACAAPSADVAVNYCRQTPQRPRRKQIRRGQPVWGGTPLLDHELNSGWSQTELMSSPMSPIRTPSATSIRSSVADMERKTQTHPDSRSNP
ncbi:putative phage integrase [Actinacidiphila reveromycinica]|uniref:Putative phage integrase n=1 Tax=Actinacidiphila reveromycinica TaxID=659352 RepID=A0A7U3UTU3_9ACTN|nr:putative phage integrase [Streptomyces sp. SN-593]